MIRYANKGFTLIEILVAMAILGICLVTILQLFSGGLRSSRISRDYTKAIFHAREKMTEILLFEELAEGTLEGDFADGYRWQAQILEVGIDQEGMPSLPIDLFEITVQVLWKDGERDKLFDLKTLKTVKSQ
jgi:general secretion pathway protein I